MNILTNEVVKILDKLYNLRGEDSVILTQMEEEKSAAEETKLRTSQEKELLQEKISRLANEESSLKEQGERLSNVLDNINETDYQFVIDKLGLDFNPVSLKVKLDERLPETINSLVTEANKAEEELSNVEEEMNDAITKIEELGIRKDAALALQEKLNEYFDLALNGNINITRDAITSLLEKFGFTDEEQREAAKILMFPEDALYEYDKEQKGGKSISEVIQEAKGYSSESVNSSIEDIVPSADNKEEIKNTMEEVGLDYLDYTNTDLDTIALYFDKDTMRNNVEYAKTVSLELEIFADNVRLLTDKEFIQKTEKLFGLEKTALDICLNPSVLTKYTYDELIRAIDLLKESGLDPRKVPLMAY
ncbi:MAG: hypothetical protein J6B98_03385 [Bacilli bacterium]|nr:hypothetical protein [Bacilli bacterium]